MFALALVLSFAGLLAGPMLVHWARGRAVFEAAFAGLTLGLIPVLILARFLPELVIEFGLMAPALFAVGYLASWWLQSRVRQRSSMAPNLVTLALAAHGLTDGAALAVLFKGAWPMTATASAALIAALVAHKIPEGLFVASTSMRVAGTRPAVWRAIFIGSATVTGGIGGRELLRWAPEAVVHGLFALGLGVMLRVVTHQHADSAGQGWPLRVKTGCFVSGVAMAMAIPSPAIAMRSVTDHGGAGGAVASLVPGAAAWLAASLVLIVGLRGTLGRLLHRAVDSTRPRLCAKPGTKSVATPNDSSI
jgi:hypothetical protein